MPARRTKKAAAPVVEVVEDDMFEDVEELEDVEDDDLEDLDDEPEPEPKPTKKGRAAKATKETAAEPKPKRAQTSGFDANWLATHVNESIEDANYTSREIRMVLRKLARDGVLEREVGTDRTRYDFPKGANDPIVKAVVKHIRTGALKAEKAEKLAELKAKGAAKKAKAAVPAVETTTAAPAKKRRRKATEEE